MNKSNYFIIGIMLVSTWVSPALGQQDSLSALVKKFDDYRTHALQEKLFVHTDRSFYLTGETMWFKVYLMDGIFHRPLDLSKVAYLEVLDKDNKAVLQAKIAINNGSGQGAFFFPASLGSGNYLLRAYTQWMRNFSPDFYFQEQLTIVNPFTKLGLKPRDEKPGYDVQFFPEGGNLVSGLKSKVAFRAVDKNGKGIHFRGVVLDDLNDTVARFQPLQFGIGHFSFIPLSNHTYKAVIQDAKGNNIIFPFPTISPEGCVIHVSDTTSNRIKITVNSQFAKETKPVSPVYLLVHTRQVIKGSEGHILEQGKTVFLMDKKSLGEGISHLTIFNNKMVPLCERLYFKRPDNHLIVGVQADQTLYSERGKITLNIDAHTQDGKPQSSNLSLAVYRTDSLQSIAPADMASYVWLTSELKGVIESPGYYLNAKEDTADEAMDNLMLTHGWSRFRWENVLSHKSDPWKFMPEYRGQILTASVSDAGSGAPRKRISTFLSAPGKNIQLYVSRSNQEGRVQFEIRDLFATNRIIIQTNSQVDSTCRIELVTPFSQTYSSYGPKIFDISEKLKNSIARRSLHMQLYSSFYEEKNSRIIAPVIDSIAFYGQPDEKYLLDDFTRFPTMEEVMREYVPGVIVRRRKGKFHFLTLDHTNNSLFRDNPMVLLDGVPVFDIDKIMAYDPHKVRKLDVITRKYFLGDLSFDGLVSYTTYQGDLKDFQPDSRALLASYEGLQLTKEFFAPRYETQQARESRIPDSRSLLYWSPDIKTNDQGKQKLDFFASDVPGKYTVVVQGLTKMGKPGTTSITFNVASRDNY